MKYIPYIFVLLIVQLFSFQVQAQNRAVSVHLSSTDWGVEGDLITKTIYVPEGFTPNYTYYSAMGWWGTQDEGDGYCGIQQHPSGRNYIFSLWDPESTNEPITAAYTGHGTQVENFGGEGTGLKSWNFALGWDTDTWYRIVTRIWDYNNHTYFGYFVQNKTTQDWYHLVTMDYPVPNVRINSGINSFLEDWYGNGWEVRGYQIKDGYKRKLNGEWQSFEKGKFSVNQEAATANYNDNYDGGVANDECFYMYSGGNTEATCGTQVTFTLNQPATPTFENIELLALNSRYDAIEKTLYLNWENNNKTNPQLSYHIHIFDNEALEGTPVFSYADSVPQLRTKDLNLNEFADGEYFLQFYVADITDSISNTIVKNISINTQVTEPVANFTVSNDTVYQYSFVNFVDQSTGIPSNWDWEFEGANPNNSSERFPIVSYSNSGFFQVSLTVGNDFGTNIHSVDSFITVLPAPDNAIDLRSLAGDFVEIPALDLTESEFTFEGWIYIEKDQQEYAGIFFNRNGSGSGLNFKANNELGYHWNGKYYSWYSGLKVPQNEWSHVALVINDTCATIYLNGVPSVNKASHDVVEFSTPSKLGADEAIGRNFSGLMDEVRIWKKALAPDQILDDRYKDIDKNHDALIAYYKCNQKNTLGLFDVCELRHGNFKSLPDTAWFTSFNKINSIAKPEANFAPSKRVAEIGEVISFYDASAFVPVEWNWEFDGATPATSTDRFPKVVYSQAGKFGVKLVVKNSAGADSIEYTNFIEINNPPAPIAIFAANKVNIYRDETVSFTNLSKNNPSSYEWYFEGGTPEYSTEFEPTVLYDSVGKFDVQLIATHDYGADTLLLESYITVNWPMSVKQEENFAKILSTAEGLQIEVVDSKGAYLKVQNILGQALYSKKLNRGTNHIHTKFNDGIYILTVENGHSSLTKKIYIQNNNF